MTKSFFITGTDTGIGKTFASCALLHALRNNGTTAVGYKPVAAGSELYEGQLCNEDAVKLQAASSPGFSLADINPICLHEACAPHLAARTEAVHLSLAPLLAGYSMLQARATHVIVEGVGGFRVPLGDDFDSADLAHALSLPVVLVIGLRLGCINHALLTTEAILARDLPLAGWIGNTLTPKMSRLHSNIEALHTLLPAPCLGILPQFPTCDPTLAARHIHLT